VTVILRFFVMTTYTFATSPGHLSQLLFRPLAPSFVLLSLSTGNSRQLATRAAIEFICPIHHNHPSPSSVCIIEIIHPAMVTKVGKSPATEVASTKVGKLPVTAELASGHVTRSARNAGTFVSAKAAVTKTVSARNAGAFASAKAAVAKTAALLAPHMEEDTSAEASLVGQPSTSAMDTDKQHVLEKRNILHDSDDDISPTAGGLVSLVSPVQKAKEKANAAIANDTTNNKMTVTNSPGELVVRGKSPPVRKAKDKAIAAIATDLDATALTKDSSSKTVTTATKVAKVAVLKKVRIIFSYFFILGIHTF
jgi:hypothetical protein